MEFPSICRKRFKHTTHLKVTCCFSVELITFQMKQTCVVEIFCELNLEIYDRAIGESISKLAFEAVEKIIQVH